jgi:peptidoglycan/xylan/chitin deacetylase (PgdA/CDA1 family)
VREFYQKGMEIASHSVSHGHPKASTFKDEANKQKQNLARMARIPHTKIKGWRSPFLEPLGDAQPNMLLNPKRSSVFFVVTLKIIPKKTESCLFVWRRIITSINIYTIESL